MPPKPSQSIIAGVARRAAVRAPGAGQRRNPEDEVRALSDDVDQLARLESMSSRSAADHDRKVALVERIAARACGLRQHYRGPSAGPCHAAPLHVSDDGLKAVF